MSGRDPARRRARVHERRIGAVPECARTPSCGFVDYLRAMDAGEEIDETVYDSQPLD